MTAPHAFRVDLVARSAVAASHLVLIPVQPSPFDVWAAGEIVDIVAQCAAFKPDLKTRFLINRLIPRTTLAAEVNGALAEYPIPRFNTIVHNRTEYAKSAKEGLTVLETAPRGIAAQEIHDLTEELCALLEGASIPKEQVRAQQ